MLGSKLLTSCQVSSRQLEGTPAEGFHRLPWYELCRSLETSGGTTQSLSVSDRHLAELNGDTLRLFGLGALDALDGSGAAQSPDTITTIAFRYIPFNAIVPLLPRVRVRFPNLSVSAHSYGGPCYSSDIETQ